MSGALSLERSERKQFLVILGIALAPLFLTALTIPMLWTKWFYVVIDLVSITGGTIPPIAALAILLWAGVRYFLARGDDDRARRSVTFRAAMGAFLAGLGTAVLVTVGLLCLLCR